MMGHFDDGTLCSDLEELEAVGAAVAVVYVKERPLS